MKLFICLRKKNGATANTVTREIMINILMLIFIDVFGVYFTFFDYITTYTKLTEGEFEKSLWLVAIYLARAAIFICSICSICKSKNICENNLSRSIKKRIAASVTFVLMPFFLILLFSFIMTLNVEAIFEPISIFLFYFLLYISLYNKFFNISSVHGKFFAITFFLSFNSAMTVLSYFFLFNCNFFFQTPTARLCNVFEYWTNVFTTLCQDIFSIVPAYLLTVSKKHTV